MERRHIGIPAMSFRVVGLFQSDNAMIVIRAIQKLPMAMFLR